MMVMMIWWGNTEIWMQLPRRHSQGETHRHCWVTHATLLPKADKERGQISLRPPQMIWNTCKNTWNALYCYKNVVSYTSGRRVLVAAAWSPFTCMITIWSSVPLSWYRRGSWCSSTSRQNELSLASHKYITCKAQPNTVLCPNAICYMLYDISLVKRSQIHIYAW